MSLERSDILSYAKSYIDNIRFLENEKENLDKAILDILKTITDQSKNEGRINFQVEIPVDTIVMEKHLKYIVFKLRIKDFYTSCRKFDKNYLINISV